jgi:hypothetical protein
MMQAKRTYTRINNQELRERGEHNEGKKNILFQIKT